MKVTYKVIDTRTNEDITDKYDWVLQPNGRLAYNAYGDLIGLTYAEAIFNAEGTEQKPGKWQFAGDGIVECSVCEEAYEAKLLPRNYCPNCGAKMYKRD